MTYEEIFERSKDSPEKIKAENYQGKIAVQINITGEGHGSFYVRVSDGKTEVQPYDYVNNDAYVIASADELLYALENIAGDTLALYGSLDKIKEFKELLLSIPKKEKQDL
ncbi:MAG: hypothetical protein IJ736_02560 [Firmicutes bacterium]|nr:hypothetical protein [Bacillota bacterium]